jgi:hypothetical protein
VEEDQENFKNHSPDFSGLFRGTYYFVSYLAIYVGVFCMCYYWPMFIQMLLNPSLNAQTEFISGIFITPLGFLFIGGVLGRKWFLFHLLTLLALSATVFMFVVSDGESVDIKEINSIWIPTMFGLYALSCLLVAIRKIRKEH